MSDGGRIAALREMVALDPSDGLARLLLGRELLAANLHAEAAAHLAAHLQADGGAGDKGAAYGALATALAALGRREEALTALVAGMANARAHRHLGLVASLEEQREALEPR